MGATVPGAMLLVCTSMTYFSAHIPDSAFSTSQNSSATRRSSRCCLGAARLAAACVTVRKLMVALMASTIPIRGTFMLPIIPAPLMDTVG